jgi:hypothetical protein
VTPDQQEAQWRNRFIVMNLARIGGTIACLLGILLWHSDVFIRGGSWIGFPIAIAGLVESFFGPRYLARQWRTPPEP